MANTLSPAREKRRRGAAGVSEMPEGLPLMIDATQAAAIISTTPKFVRDRCQDGTIKAVKCGKVWRINRDAFLQQFGLSEV